VYGAVFARVRSFVLLRGKKTKQKKTRKKKPHKKKIPKLCPRNSGEQRDSVNLFIVTSKQAL
jgi:hypothetical protein